MLAQVRSGGHERFRVRLRGMSIDPEQLDFDVSNGVDDEGKQAHVMSVRVTLNRPERMNAVDSASERTLATYLLGAIRDLERDRPRPGDDYAASSSPARAARSAPAQT